MGERKKKKTQNSLTVKVEKIKHESNKSAKEEKHEGRKQILKKSEIGKPTKSARKSGRSFPIKTLFEIT